MDALARLGDPGADLLRRVDAALLEHGAPVAHPVWELMRRIRCLPGAFVDNFRYSQSEPLRDAAVRLRDLADAYAQAAERVPVARNWSGTAADAYAYRWRALESHLVAGTPSMYSQLLDTAKYLDEVAEWIDDSRDEIAYALAECLGSREAVALTATAGPGGREHANAAATVGVWVMRAAAAALTQGEAVAARWRDRLGDLRYQPPAGLSGSGLADLTLPG